MKRLWAFSSTLTVGLVAFALIGPTTTAAQATSLQQLCNYDDQCWFNNGPDQYITSSANGTGWAAEAAPGYTFNGHQAIMIFAGNDTCATDDGVDSYLATTNSRCSTSNPDSEELFYLAPSGALVSVWTTGQLGHYECLTVLSNGKIGNFQCPSGAPPIKAHWEFL